MNDIQPTPDTGHGQKKNDAFLLHLAETYVHLENLHRMGSEHWAEDCDPLLVCMTRLFDVACSQPVYTPQGVMALTAMSLDGPELKSDGYEDSESLEHKAIRAARDILLSGEFVLGGW